MMVAEKQTVASRPASKTQEGAILYSTMRFPRRHDQWPRLRHHRPNVSCLFREPGEKSQNLGWRGLRALTTRTCTRKVRSEFREHLCAFPPSRLVTVASRKASITCSLCEQIYVLGIILSLLGIVQSSLPAFRRRAAVSELSRMRFGREVDSTRDAVLMVSPKSSKRCFWNRSTPVVMGRE